MNSIATSLGGRQRQNGFYGMSGVAVQRNSIKACVYGEQTVSDGQSLRLRLLEPMSVSAQILPIGSILVGSCHIGIDRLLVTVLSIECDGVISQVTLNVYDGDGQQGLYVPGSLELEAGREIGSDIASSIGSSASQQVARYNTQSATEQIKSDIGRGTVQGVFRYVGRRLQEIKVTVQDKHNVFLSASK
jgi:conjugative transposon TraM protein